MSERHALHALDSRPRPLLSRLRPKSVRAKIVALLMVPVISLMVLWALATVSTVQSAWTLRQLEELDNNLTGPVRDLVTSLQSERAAVTRHLSPSSGSGQQPALEQRHARTVQAMRALRDGVGRTSADIASLAPAVNRRIETVSRDLAQLQDDQAAIVARQKDWQSAYHGYSGAIDDVFAVEAALTKAEGGSSAQVVLPLAQIGEMLARQDAVANAAQTTGQMTEEQHRAFADAVGGQQALSANVLPDLPSELRSAYQGLLRSEPYRSFTSLQNAVLGDEAGRAVATEASAGRWRAAAETVTQDLGAIQADASAAATAEAEVASATALRQGAVTVILGLLAVLLALLISVRIGRGLMLELVGLKDSGLELAHRRLPQAMRRLRAGEKIDVDADVPVVPPGDGEIGQVGDALNAVQRAALQAAAERAELLTGVSGVFVTLARRSQSLVHRQLSLLDAMERRNEDPAELEDLFRLDHLAARMRRHAEGLIIMSGAAPGRVWSEPVPLMTVIRAAVAEVEDFQRVEIRRVADVSVQGSAVADLTHMIAELVENAASFSPPNTTVLVHGEPVGAGFVVEIEDRGLGMRPESMAEANRRIAEAHQLDLFDREQLGFFVVSRLAKRQNITVTLRRSAFGGTTAVLLLPTAMLMPFAPYTAAIEDTRPAARTAVATRAQEVRQSDMVSTSATWTGQLPTQPGPPARQLPTSTVRAAGVSPRVEVHGDDGTGGLPRRRPRVSLAADPPVEEPVEEPVDDATGGLPRRRPQANLAPGLRDEDGGNGEHAGAAVPRTSPEQARAAMSALQQGFTRGRNG
ncbi:MAG: ATPase [Pseudonocardiaceae bacterium]|nr:ATPase [Pseudonocardiaceae bacterium]